MRLIGMGERALQLLVQVRKAWHLCGQSGRLHGPPVEMNAQGRVPCVHNSTSAVVCFQLALSLQFLTHLPLCAPFAQRSNDRVAFKQQLWRHQSVRLDIARSRVELDAARWVP